MPQKGHGPVAAHGQQGGCRQRAGKAVQRELARRTHIRHRKHPPYWIRLPSSLCRVAEQGLYLSDIQDHLITMTQNLNHYEKILSRSHSNYLAQISIEMTDANNQINDVLSKLTALGTVLIPMNLVTGELSANQSFDCS